MIAVKLVAFKSLNEERAELGAPSLFLSEKCIDNPDYIVAPVAYEAYQRGVYPRQVYWRRTFCLYDGKLYTIHAKVPGVAPKYVMRRSSCRKPMAAIQEYMANLAAETCDTAP